MHFECVKCFHEFCNGCRNAIVKNCNKPHCAGQRKHAHHPRNCLYYLRDMDAPELEKLLSVTNILLKLHYIIKYPIISYISRVMALHTKLQKNLINRQLVRY